MIGLNNLVPRVLSYWLRVGENPWNEVVDWIVVWLDWISLHKSQTACPRGSTGILDYSLRKICEIVRFALRAATWLGATIRIGISNMDTFSSGGVWLFSGTTHYSTSIKIIVLNAQTFCFTKYCYDREQCRIQTLKKRWGGGLQNIFFGPAAINGVEGNIDTFSTRVRSREKEYGSRWTNSISATLSLAYLSQVLEEIRFQIDSDC